MSRTSSIPLLAALLALAASCGDNTSPVVPDNGDTLRSFALGFTDFPHARTDEAYLAAWDAIENEGDMAVLHFDDGIPWPEALAEIRYDETFEGELSFKESRTPRGHVVYLAVTPIAATRDGLALYRGATPNLPLPPPWDTLSFDDADVIAAFINHCEWMAERFVPDYFAYAIEANMLIGLAPQRWSEFVALAQAVYTRMKALHPSLPVFVTLQTEFYYDDPAAQQTALAAILPYTDMIALSSYAYGRYPDPADMPVDYFSALLELAPGKRMAIAETAWPAEDVTAPYPIVIPATEITQLAYVERLLRDADSLEARFVSWFFSRDFDDFWEAELQFAPNSNLIRFWKDTGLYDGEGNLRPALTRWREELARPLNR